jgi:hypothetical protein
MKELNLELGQWVSCMDGYGQIMYIRAYHVEDYENYRQGRKNGEFIKFVYIIKILCGFDGKIKKSNRIKIDTSCSPIDKKGLKFVGNIKIEQKEEYDKYILYDEKNSITDQLILEFKLDRLDFDEEELNDQLTEIYFNLFPSFTYKEFAQEFKKYNFPFKLENLISYGGSPHPCVTLRLDSVLYKTKDKQAIFNDIRIRYPKKNDDSENDANIE